MPSSKKRKLPSHLHAVMGEANLRLARGDPTGAQKLCKEVIRQGVYVCNSAYDKYLPIFIQTFIIFNKLNEIFNDNL